MLRYFSVVGIAMIIWIRTAVSCFLILVRLIICMCEGNTPYLRGNRAAPAPVPAPSPLFPSRPTVQQTVLRWHNGVISQDRISFCRDPSPTATIRRSSLAATSSLGQESPSRPPSAGKVSVTAWLKSFVGRSLPCPLAVAYLVGSPIVLLLDRDAGTDRRPTRVALHSTM